MAEIQGRSQAQPPIFLRQVEDCDRCCQSDLVSSDEKTGESEVGANLNGLLTCVCVELQLLWKGLLCGIPVIMEIHTDFRCPFQTPDRTLTRRIQMLRDDDIFSMVEQKKQTKQRRTAPFLSIHL